MPNNKSCYYCKYCNVNNCTLKNNALEDGCDLKEQGCAAWEPKESDPE